MGLLSNIYQRIDKRLGGILPGGQKQTAPSPPKAQIQYTAPIGPNRPTANNQNTQLTPSDKMSVERRSGGGGGTGRSQAIFSNVPMPSKPTADQTITNIMRTEAELRNIQNQNQQMQSPDNYARAKQVLQAKYMNAVNQSREPYLEERQVSTYKPDFYSKEVPVTKVYYTDPNTGKSREASPEESVYYRSQREVQASTVPYSKTRRVIGEAKGKIIETYKYGNKSGAETLENLNLTDENISRFSKAAGYGGLPMGSKVREFTENITSSVLMDIKNKPLGNLLLVGGGGAVGFISKGAVAFIPKLAMPIKAIEIGGGGLWAFDVGKQIKNVGSSPSGLGGVVGLSAKDAFLFGKGYKGGAKPFKQEFTIKKTSSSFNYGLDTIQPIIMPEGQIEISKFNLRMSSPEIKVYSDTPIKKFFRSVLGFKGKSMQPKVEKVIPPRVTTQVGMVITKEGKILYGQTLTNRPGSTLKYVGLVGGEQKPFDITDFKNDLSPIEVYTLDKFTGGFAPSGYDYFKGNLITKKLFRLSGISGGQVPRESVFMQFPKPGRSVSRYSTIGGTAEVANAEGEYSLYKTVLGLKRQHGQRTKYSGLEVINKGRRRGGIEKIWGFSKVLEPVSVDYGIEDLKIKGVRSGKPLGWEVLDKPAVKAAAATITGIKKASADQLSRSSTTPNVKASQEFERVNLLPTYVGGGGQKETSVFMDSLVSYEDSMSGFVELSVSRGVEKLFNPSIDIPTVTSKGGARSVSKEYASDIVKDFLGEGFKEIFKTPQKTAQKTAQKNIQRFIPKTPQKNVLIERPFAPTTSIPNNILKSPREIRGRSKLKNIKSQKDIFSVFTRRRGKWIPIARGYDFNKIVGAGRGKVEDTLAVSLKFYKNKTPITPKARLPGAIYGRSVRDPFVFIQKKGGRKAPTIRGARLSSPGERREIKASRNTLKLFGIKSKRKLKK